MKQALCFHGFRTNASVMKYQTAKLREALPDFAFTYIDGPLPASGPAEEAVRDFWQDEPFFQFWDAEEVCGGKLQYSHANESLEHVVDFIEKRGPFDILVGFSHGANFITMLTQHYELLGDSSKVPYRAVLLVCGGANGPDQSSFNPVRDTLSFGTENGAQLATPSIHIIGENDPIAEASHALCRAYSSNSSTVIVHSGGHDFPRPVRKVCGRGRRQQQSAQLDYYSLIAKQVHDTLVHECVAESLSLTALSDDVTHADTSIQHVADCCIKCLSDQGCGYVQLKHHLQLYLMRPLTPMEKRCLTRHLEEHLQRASMVQPQSSWPRNRACRSSYVYTPSITSFNLHVQ